MTHWHFPLEGRHDFNPGFANDHVKKGRGADQNHGEEYSGSN
jgi:hypothetical protein